MNEQKEKLAREIAELKGVRDVFLEETTVLNARNEELAQLSAVYARRLENAAPAPETPSKPVSLSDASSRTSSDTHRGANQYSSLIVPSLSSSTSGSSTIYDDASESSRHLRTPKSENELTTPAKGGKFKWMASSKAKENVPSPALSAIESTKSKAHIEHNFQQLSVLRFARCDHCGEKMWGSQLRCTRECFHNASWDYELTPFSVCATSIHVRCITNVQIPCTHQIHNTFRDDPPVPLRESFSSQELSIMLIWPSTINVWARSNGASTC